MRKGFGCKAFVSMGAILVVLLFAGCSNTTGGTGSSSGSTTVHLGYFPNVTHAVALVGVARGTFKQALGTNVTLDTRTFNAGPALIEALLGNSIDIGYVGPNPAINGYVKSQGSALKIIAGASSGGALFIVRPGANIRNPNDLSGKKFATPQLGGTQDVSLRYYLLQHGLKTADKGGTVQVIPAQNPDILTLFKRGQIDGAWVPEPWASRLILEDQGQVFVDERTLWPDQKFTTTNVVVSTKFMNQHPDLVARFLQAHIDTVKYINSNLADAKQLVNNEIKRITTQALSQQVLDEAFKNLDVTYDPLAKSLLKSADNAFALGFLGSSKPDLKGIFELAPLNAILTKNGLAVVAGP